jgi:hypothetical protein
MPTVYSRSLLALILAGTVGFQANHTVALSPNPFKPNDSFVVTQSGTRLMRGDSTLATLPRGQMLQVLKVDGSWIGTAVIVDGRKLAGWVWAGQAASPEQYRATQPSAPRRYSLTPTPGANQGPISRQSKSGTRYGPRHKRADRKIRGL